MAKMKDSLLNAVKAAAEKSLKRDANSTTCYSIYQPKAPAGLERFKKTEKDV